MKSNVDPEGLQALIGRQFTWKGERYSAIEILANPITLIAQSLHTDPHIQTDIHGRARRMVESDIVSIPVLDAEGTHLHADFLLIEDWSSPKK